MGKRYLCDYCQKSLVATPSVLKTHNQGLVHQKLVHQHYQQFKDPEVILAEEAGKRPCLRAASGSCNFGGLCRYSHYTSDELNKLRSAVAVKNANSGRVSEPPLEGLHQDVQPGPPAAAAAAHTHTISYDCNGVTRLFPWQYNVTFDRYALPPSLRRLEDHDFSNVHNPEWGLG